MSEFPIFKLRERFWAGTWEVRATYRDLTHVRLEGTKRECQDWLLAKIMATPIDELFAPDPDAEVMSC